MGVKKAVIENLINKELPEQTFEKYGDNVVTISSVQNNKDKN